MVSWSNKVGQYRSIVPIADLPAFVYHKNTIHFTLFTEKQLHVTMIYKQEGVLVYIAWGPYILEKRGEPYFKIKQGLNLSVIFS